LRTSNSLCLSHSDSDSSGDRTAGGCGNGGGSGAGKSGGKIEGESEWKSGNGTSAVAACSSLGVNERTNVKDAVHIFSSGTRFRFACHSGHFHYLAFFSAGSFLPFLFLVIRFWR